MCLVQYRTIQCSAIQCDVRQPDRVRVGLMPIRE